MQSAGCHLPKPICVFWWLTLILSLKIYCGRLPYLLIQHLNTKRVCEQTQWETRWVYFESLETKSILFEKCTNPNGCTSVCSFRFYTVKNCFWMVSSIAFTFTKCTFKYNFKVKILQTKEPEQWSVSIAPLQALDLCQRKPTCVRFHLLKNNQTQSVLIDNYLSVWMTIWEKHRS